MPIYFAKNKSGFIKIGHSKNVQSRIITLNTSSHEPITLLGVVNGGRDREKEIHKRFSHLRLNSEWFEAKDELLKFITIHQSPIEEPLVESEKRDYLPIVVRAIESIGHDIKLARKRRRMSQTLLAARAGMTRVTLSNIESFPHGVTLGALAKVANSLGLIKNIEDLFKNDELGRKLQDIESMKRK